MKKGNKSVANLVPFLPDSFQILFNFEKKLMTKDPDPDSDFNQIRIRVTDKRPDPQRCPVKNNLAW